MMKISPVILAFAVGIALLACASKKETMVESTSDQTTKRTHTQEELKKTGESQLGPALEKVDPAVQSSHH